MHAMPMNPAAIGVGLGLGLGLSFSLTAMWAWSTGAGRGLLRKIMKRVGLAPKQSGFSAIGTNQLEWSRNQAHQEAVTYFMKKLSWDKRSNQGVWLIRYPAGQLNPSHTHANGHGIYVLQGTLVTHRGAFGRDTFVWFPPDEPMAHGAGPGEDLIALFIAAGDIVTTYGPCALP